MHHRPARRAIALSLGALLAFAGTASADRLLADGDVLSTTIQGTKFLGNVSAGAEVSVDVRFLLTCTGVSHVDAGQSIVLTSSGGTQPADGAIVSVTPVRLDPMPASGWAADGVGCPSPVPSLEGGVYSVVTLRAPTTVGNGYMFTVMWDRSLDPAGTSDSGALGVSSTLVSFTMNVVNVAPTITVPADFTVEGNASGGWAADWSAVGATDPEDNPDPIPTCTPAAGSTLPLGTNPVTCTARDGGGLSATRGFNVTVVDTTPPMLAGVPADADVITDDPAGSVLAYAAPTATDVVDPAPGVSCAPASGTPVGPGTTTVTCTATDASGKSSSDSFDVTVTYVPKHTASVVWHEPVDGTGSPFTANRGRTLPIKVRLFVDDTEVTTGSASVKVTPCDGGTGIELPLTIGGGRWNASLDTSLLVGSCHRVTAWVQGLEAGSILLDLRSTEPARANKTPATRVSSTPATTNTATPIKPVKPSDPKPAKTGSGKK